MRSPDVVNEAGTVRAWRFVAEPGVGPLDWSAGLASWFIEADRGVLDPVFTAWFVGSCSLRDIEGVPPAKRHYPEAQFELNCFTIDPTKGVSAASYERRVEGVLDGPAGFLMQPADLAFQWHGTTDADALEVGEAFIRAVVLGGDSPSRPVTPLKAWAFDHDWRRKLMATVEHFASGHWPAQPEGRA